MKNNTFIYTASIKTKQQQKTTTTTMNSAITWGDEITLTKDKGDREILSSVNSRLLQYISYGAAVWTVQYTINTCFTRTCHIWFTNTCAHYEVQVMCVSCTHQCCTLWCPGHVCAMYSPVLYIMMLSSSILTTTRETTVWSDLVYNWTEACRQDTPMTTPL